jgi:ketosteroid isomerase-like protein
MRDDVATTKAIFEAFGRGDVAAILERLSDDVLWEYGPSATDVPWYQPRRGKDGALAFFRSLAAVDFHVFAPTAFLGGDGVVAVLLDSDYTVRATGARVVYRDAVMLWRFDAEGKVSHFAHRVDLHQAWQAYHAPAAA